MGAIQELMIMNMLHANTCVIHLSCKVCAFIMATFDAMPI